MAFSVDELVDRFRDQMDDTEKPYFWSRERICEFIDEAQREFAVLTRIFKGSAAVDVTADDAYITLPTEAFYIRRAKLATRTKPLRLVNLSDAETHRDDDYGVSSSYNWETATGEPRIVILDETFGKGRLSPIPIEDNVITLHYFRYPTAVIAEDSVSTELQDTRHQLSLLMYARSLAYDDHDADTYNPKLAEEFHQKFTRRVNQLKSEIGTLQERVRTVTYGGL